MRAPDRGLRGAHRPPAQPLPGLQVLATSREALALIGETTWQVALWKQALTVFLDLERIAVAVTSAGSAEEGAWLFGAAAARHTALGMQLRDGQHMDHAHSATYLQQETAPQAIGEAWALGHRASVAESVALGLRSARAAGRLSLERCAYLSSAMVWPDRVCAFYPTGWGAASDQAGYWVHWRDDARTRTKETAMSISASPHSILVIEHDTWRRTDLIALLANAGFSVSDASNGFSGLRAARQSAPDAIVLGANLPDLGAADVREQLDAYPATSGIPIVSFHAETVGVASAVSSAIGRRVVRVGSA